jgi:hypothetical protein
VAVSGGVLKLGWPEKSYTALAAHARDRFGAIPDARGSRSGQARSAALVVGELEALARLSVDGAGQPPVHLAVAYREFTAEVFARRPRF